MRCGLMIGIKLLSDHMLNPLIPKLYRAGSAEVESFGSFLRALVALNVSSTDILIAHLVDDSLLGRVWGDSLIRMILAEQFIEMGADEDLVRVAATGSSESAVQWCPACAGDHPGKHLMQWEDGRERCSVHNCSLTRSCQGCGWQTFDVIHWLNVGSCPRCKHGFALTMRSN